MLHRPSAADIIDVSIRETRADWRWRSIPLHLACVVSTCLSLRQTLREIVWSWDEKGLLFWSELAVLRGDWAHRFDLHPASWKNGHGSDIKLDFSDTWVCKVCSLSSPSYSTFTVACSPTFLAMFTPKGLIPNSFCFFFSISVFTSTVHFKWILWKTSNNLNWIVWRVKF